MLLQRLSKSTPREASQQDLCSIRLSSTSKKQKQKSVSVEYKSQDLPLIIPGTIYSSQSEAPGAIFCNSHCQLRAANEGNHREHPDWRRGEGWWITQTSSCCIYCQGYKSISDYLTVIVTSQHVTVGHCRPYVSPCGSMTWEWDIFKDTAYFKGNVCMYYVILIFTKSANRGRSHHLLPIQKH